MTIENETRQRILDTALALFAEHGYSGVSTADIAREADINKALIFYYFGSKKELYRASFRLLRDKFLDRLGASTASDTSDTGHIEMFIRAHIGFLHETPEMAHFLIHELIAAKSGSSLNQDDLMNMFLMVLKNLGGAIRQGVEDGTLRDVNPIQTVISIVSLDVFFFLQKPLIILMGFDKMPDTDVFEDSREDHVIDLVMNGIRNKGDAE